MLDSCFAKLKISSVIGETRMPRYQTVREPMVFSCLSFFNNNPIVDLQSHILCSQSAVDGLRRMRRYGHDSTLLLCLDGIKVNIM
jgi:hypothetical protein